MVNEESLREIVAKAGEPGRAYHGKRVLVTGALGFLGTYLTAALCELGAEVVAMDNLSTSENASLPAGARFVRASAAENAPFAGMPAFDFYVHAAGIASPHYYRKMPLATMDAATTGLRRVLDRARVDGASVLSMSSSEIYGDPDAAHVPTDETYNGNVTCLGSRACYDESKRFGETLARVYFEEHGVRTVIARPFNVFGPGMRRDDYRVLPNFARSIADGLPLEVYGTGKQTRTFCYATDATAGFLRLLALGRPGEAYNVGNPDPEISMVDLAGLALRAAGVEAASSVVPVPHPESYPADEPRRRCPKIDKARADVGYAPSVALEDGLRRFFAWAVPAYSQKSESVPATPRSPA